MHLTMFLFLLLANCSVVFLVEAQKENNVWHYGYAATLDFNTSPPTRGTNPAGNASWSEATISTICDTSGSVLFYTDGEIVFNRNHARMPNGNNLGAGRRPWQTQNTLQTVSRMGCWTKSISIPCFSC